MVAETAHSGDYQLAPYFRLPLSLTEYSHFSNTLPQVSKQQRCLDSRAHGEHGMLTEKCDEDSDVAAAQTLQRHPNAGIKCRPPTLQAGSLPAEPQGKPKNTGVGSLSLLQSPA